MTEWPMAALNGDVRAQLADAIETLRAIRNGEVDALLVTDGPPGEQVFTLSSADRPYRMFVESMRDGAATVSDAGIVLYANRRLGELLGRPLAGLIGTPLSAYVGEADHGALAALSGHAGASGTIEINLIEPDGRPVPVRVGASNLQVDSEQLVCLTFADLTEPRRAQDELTRAHEHAVEASRLKSQFVANMSHEIRTPLNGVIGLTDLLLGTTLTVEQREYADGVRESGNVLMGVINEILDFSKIEAGKLELDPLPFSIAEVVEGACAVVAVLAHAKGIELLLWVDDDVPSEVVGDVDRVRQVLTNLLTNAVKFTAAGEVLAMVSAEPHGDQWRVKFEVGDTGIGIPPTSLEHIFDAFSQADGSTTRRYGGTGLGLTISKRLVELMGGDIEVESVEDEGSKFSFTLPVTALPDAQPRTDQSRLEGVRVLSVDDNATSRIHLERLTASWGMTGRAVASGDAALEELRAAPPDEAYDVAIIDADLRGISGQELASLIRAGVPMPDLRIVMLLSSQGDREAGRAVGVDGFATKPVRPARLRDEIRRVLDLPDDPNALGRHAATSVEPRPSANERHFDHGSRLVLLVEDNEINQMVTTRMLEKRGFRVDVAGNGRLAADMVAEHQYAAIFMDCQMPDLDGYEATAEIRRRDHSPRVPIIAMTANTLSGEREKCLAAGMDDYLGKPITSDTLDDAIDRWLAPPEPTTAAASARTGRVGH